MRIHSQQPSRVLGDRGCVLTGHAQGDQVRQWLGGAGIDLQQFPIGAVSLFIARQLLQRDGLAEEPRFPLGAGLQALLEASQGLFGGIHMQQARTQADLGLRAAVVDFQRPAEAIRRGHPLLQFFQTHCPVEVSCGMIRLGGDRRGKAVRRFFKTKLPELGPPRFPRREILGPMPAPAATSRSDLRPPTAIFRNRYSLAATFRE